ncbi:MAG TPA: pitrilysin family protein [Bacteroidales bacterium]|nr:pitrilysin family protein [Bacteroidales bacterium]
MTIDRTKPPSANLVEYFANPLSRRIYLSNGIPVYIISGGTQPVMRIELIYKAGSYYQSFKLVANAANSLIAAGTSGRTADEISEYFEFYGSNLDTRTEKDNAYLTLFTTNKFYKETLPVLAEVITDAIFPEEEVEIYKTTKRQTFSENLEKVKYLARVHFAEQIFGSTHPYGMRLQHKDIEQLDSQILRKFYHNYYQPANTAIFVSGLIPADFEEEIEKHLGNINPTVVSAQVTPDYQIRPSESKQILINKNGVLQSAIRYGKPVINRTHDDYQELFILNTILGGYFGSRLMRNIREDKGYTYGINSMLFSMQQSGVLVIASQVGIGVREATLKEIRKEIKLLCNEPVGDDELNTVKNYLLGSLMRSMDGPFDIAERLRAAWEYGQSAEYYHQYAHTIKSITPPRLLELANVYLDPESFFETVAGK